MAQRTAWALPTRPPAAWVGARCAVALLAAVIACVLLSLLGLRSDGAPGVVVATAVGSSAALLTAYALLVQSTVTGDDRLGWVATGYVAVAPLLLLHGTTLGGPGRELDQLDRAAWLALLSLAVVPAWALTAGLAGRRPSTLWALLTTLAVAALAIVTVPDGLPRVVNDLQEPLTPLRLGFATLALLGALASAQWRHGADRGVRWTSCPCFWIWTGLVLTACSAAVQALETQRWSTSWWIGLTTQTVALVVPALGLSLLTSTGYRRQSRRWRHLVAEVGRLRAASLLLPVLSVTPEDQEGLPEPSEVRALIDNGRVRMALQPIVSLKDGAVVGYEALSRFGGRVPTDRGFRAASLCGLGDELERVALQAALALLPRLPDEVFLAVNVSPAALEDDTVQQLLDSVDLRRIVVEVTEHEAVADYGITRSVLERLRDRGARIAVDDMGADAASLRHVLMLQPDVIKLDTGLTREVDTSERQQNLIIALTDFAREVGAVVLAKGIETEEQLVALRKLGVPYGQGWHLGVPTLAAPAAGG